jgi:hypothetical protein
MRSSVSNVAVNISSSHIAVSKSHKAFEHVTVFFSLVPSQPEKIPPVFHEYGSTEAKSY